MNTVGLRYLYIALGVSLLNINATGFVDVGKRIMKMSGAVGKDIYDLLIRFFISFF
jgi:hypothetical protein